MRRDAHLNQALSAESKAHSLTRRKPEVVVVTGASAGVAVPSFVPLDAKVLTSDSSLADETDLKPQVVRWNLSVDAGLCLKWT